MTGGTSDKAPDLPYRRGVGAVLFNTEGKVFVGRRADQRHAAAWQLPQGGIGEGEAPDQAVLRELAEETGTDKAHIIAETRDWLTYDLPERLVGVSWGGRYRGQKQKWFALRFTGEDSDFDLDAHGKPEFSDWRWVALDDLAELIVDFKRPMYRAILAEFRHLPDQITGGA